MAVTDPSEGLAKLIQAGSTSVLALIALVVVLLAFLALYLFRNDSAQIRLTVFFVLLAVGIGFGIAFFVKDYPASGRTIKMGLEQTPPTPTPSQGPSVVASSVTPIPSTSSPTATPLRPIVVNPPDQAPGEPPYSDFSFKPSMARDVAVSFDGAFVAVVSNSGTTFLHFSGTSELQVVNTIYGEASSVRFSATGDAFISGVGLREVKLPSFEATQVLQPAPRYLLPLAMSPDGLILAWCHLPLTLPNSPLPPQEVGGLDLTNRTRDWRSSIILPQPSPSPPGPLRSPRQIYSLFFLSESRLLLASLPFNGLDISVFDIPTKQLTNSEFKDSVLFLGVLQNAGEAIVAEQLPDKTNLGFLSVDAPGPVTVLRSFPKSSFFRGAISPGEKALAVTYAHVLDIVGKSPERSIIIWDLRTQKIVREWSCPNAEMVCWLPEGDLLAAGEGLFRRYYLHSR
jgi:hypothetical protein